MWCRVLVMNVTVKHICAALGITITGEKSRITCRTNSLPCKVKSRPSTLSFMRSAHSSGRVSSSAPEVGAAFLRAGEEDAAGDNSPSLQRSWEKGQAVKQEEEKRKAKY